MTWQVQEARAKFDELLEATLHDGPQVVERDGAAMAVLVPVEEWKRLQSARVGPGHDQDSSITPARTFKELLLHGSPGIDDMMIPERGSWLHREPPEF